MSVLGNNFIFNPYDIQVSVNEGVVNTWEKFRQTRTDSNESFGIITGSHSDDNKRFCIEDCTTPKRKDKATRFQFSMSDSFHQAFVNTSFKTSNGTIGYIGTWHTHPEEIPNPSTVDIQDWQSCMTRNPDRNLIFVIVGTEKIKAFISVENIFISTYLEKLN